MSRRFSLALHETGHVIVATAFGLLLDKIEMDYERDGGCVWYEDGYEKKTSVEQRTVLALAGLAAERFFHKDCGVVYRTEKVTDSHYRLHGPKELEGLSNEDYTDDLSTVHDFMPIEVRIKWGKDEEWCNRHLKAAWDLLHENEEAFLEMYKALHPRSKHQFGEQLNRHRDAWTFQPGALKHILRKVKRARKRRTAEAA